MNKMEGKNCMAYQVRGLTEILCYRGCSEHNPHRAKLCMKILDYSSECPTNKRLMEELK